MVEAGYAIIRHEVGYAHGGMVADGRNKLVCLRF